MDFVRWGLNPWGQNILEHVSWTLFWASLFAGLMFLVAHGSYMLLSAHRKRSEAETDRLEAAHSNLPERIQRHSARRQARPAAIRPATVAARPPRRRGQAHRRGRASPRRQIHRPPLARAEDRHRLQPSAAEGGPHSALCRAVEPHRPLGPGGARRRQHPRLRSAPRIDEHPIAERRDLAGRRRRQSG